MSTRPTSTPPQHGAAGVPIHPGSPPPHTPKCPLCVMEASAQARTPTQLCGKTSLGMCVTRTLFQPRHNSAPHFPHNPRPPPTLTDCCLYQPAEEARAPRCACLDRTHARTHAQVLITHTTTTQPPPACQVGTVRCICSAHTPHGPTPQQSRALFPTPAGTPSLTNSPLRQKSQLLHEQQSCRLHPV